MRPRPALLLGALVVPVLPFVAVAPAQAATNVICVNRPTDNDCQSRPTSITTAIAQANVDGQDSVIRIGPGTYTDGPYVFSNVDSSLTVQGSNNGTGDNATILQGGATSPYVTATNATVRNFRITLTGAAPVGLSLSGATGVAQNVIVADTPTTTPSDAVGIRAEVGAVVQNSTVNLVRGAGNTGFEVKNATVSRATSRVSGVGVLVTGGTLAIDNSVLDLDVAGSTGLRAANDDSTGNVTVDAKYLTVVGGVAGARGVWAYSPGAAVASSTVTLVNSIVRGPTHSLAATAGSGGSATVGVSYTDYSTEQETGAGTAVVNPGAGNLDVDPAFIDPASADYELRAGSPVVDKGSISVISGNDRNDLARAFDGDGNGSAVPDMGAYELRDRTAPQTTITDGPGAATNDNTPLFQFKASEDGVTFQCQIDGGVFQACSSPVTTTPLPDGPHSFSVRATDAVFNVETVPATRSFTIDTVRPGTSLTKTPQKRFYKPRVKFRFVSDEAGVRFKCQLDNLAWRNCSSPYSYSVKVGKHRLLVRAVDAAGNTDATPARYKFKRVPRPRPHHHHHHHR